MLYLIITAKLSTNNINNNHDNIYLTMNKIILISFAFIILFGIVPIQTCKYDFDCGYNKRCFMGRCQDCMFNADCLKYGKNYICVGGVCIHLNNNGILK